jgi:hypothetical protein
MTVLPGSHEHVCWLAAHGVYHGRAMARGQAPMPPCSGELVRCHLIPRQLIRRTLLHAEGAEAVDRVIADPRSWVPGCGGPHGNGGHHGQFDQSRTLRIPRRRLPAGLVELAEEIGLLWWLCSEYGCSVDCTHPGRASSRASGRR